MIATTKKQLLTHSRQNSFKGCRKQHYFEYELGLRPIIEAKACRMGSAFHAGLEALQVTGNAEEANMAVVEYYRKQPEIENVDFEMATVVCLVSGYSWRWGEEFEVIATEKEFRIPLVNPTTGRKSHTFNLAGKIDGIVELQDGRLAVIEHKLLGDNIDTDSDLWRRLRIDSQVTMYVYAARQLGYNVDCVIYDVCRKPTIRVTDVAEVDEDGNKVVLDVHGDRVFNANGAPRQTASTKDGYTVKTRPMNVDEWTSKLLTHVEQNWQQYYARHEIVRLDHEIDEYMAELWDIQKTLRSAQLNNTWYRTCSRNTCTYCPFFSICSNGLDESEVPEGFVASEDIHPELQGV